jgi:hypothetical protein
MEPCAETILMSYTALQKREFPQTQILVFNNVHGAESSPVLLNANYSGFSAS